MKITFIEQMAAVQALAPSSCELICGEDVACCRRQEVAIEFAVEPAGEGDFLVGFDLTFS